MSDYQYQEIFETWRNKTLSEGFTLNQFRSRYNFFVERDNICELTKAVGAKMAYMSLVKQHQEELRLVQSEMENVRWI
jgi:hypothetical protein